VAAPVREVTLRRRAVLGVHHRLVQHSVAWYRQGDVEQVRSHRIAGVSQAAFLTEEAQTKVSDAVASGQFLPVRRDLNGSILEDTLVTGGFKDLAYSLDDDLRLIPRNHMATLLGNQMDAAGRESGQVALHFLPESIHLSGDIFRKVRWVLAW
jgi:hypothetical protein